MEILLSKAGLTAVWIVLLLLFLAVEAATVQLVSAWFALGALGALIANLCGCTPVWQLILFLGISAVCLLATRPVVKKLTATKLQRTNADRCIGQIGIVLEPVDNVQATGQVKVGGSVWSAQSADAAIIDAGKQVTVEKITGVKLIVREKQNGG